MMKEIVEGLVEFTKGVVAYAVALSLCLVFVYIVDVLLRLF